MINVNITILDDDNFFKDGLRQIVLDYFTTIRDSIKRNANSQAFNLHHIDDLEIIFREKKSQWGCEKCYDSIYDTPHAKQLTLLLQERLPTYESRSQDEHKQPTMISHTSSIETVKAVLQHAISQFCQTPTPASIAQNPWVCYRCRLKELSKNERKILALSSTGLSGVAIAQILKRSQKTISLHKRSAMRKLDISKNSKLNEILLSEQLYLQQSMPCEIEYSL